MGEWNWVDRGLTPEDVCAYMKLYCCDTTADALAVEEAPVVAGAMTFQVVPNPARAGSVSLRLSDALRRHARSVRVVDALGAVILEMRLSPEPGAPGFDISGLAAGAYFVQVTHDGGIVGEKLVIER